MFDSLEIRKVKNGFVVTVVDEDGAAEYIFDTQRRMFKFLKERVEGKDIPE